MLERFYVRRVALTTILPALRLGGLDDLSVDAAPTELYTIFAVLERSGWGIVAFTISLPALRFGGRDQFSVDTAPAGLAMFARFFFGIVTLTPVLPAIRLRGRENLSVDTAPAGLTIFMRFFFGGEALTLPFQAILRRGQDDLPVDAAPTLRRWRRVSWWRISWRRGRQRPRRRRASTFGRTGKRLKPARRWLRWTRRVVTRRAMPFIAMATSLEPPSPILLLPNPLATRVAPLPASDRRRSQQESVLLAAGGNALAHDETAIVDRFRRTQDAEVALRKIAQRV